MGCNSIQLLLLALLLALVADAEAKVSAIIVFGDSSVDSGNNNMISTVLRSNFKPYGRDFEGGRPTGRFSNGRIPPDFISAAFGLKPAVPAYLDPAYNIADFATGVCFASAGTGYDNATSDVLSVLPLWKELEYYKDYKRKLRSHFGQKKTKEIISEALYLMSLGTNDFLENYYVLSRRSSQFTVQQYEDFLAGIAENFIKEIYGLGARKVSLGALPPMGCLPLERTRNFMTAGNCVEEYNAVAREFNGKLQTLVVKLNDELKGIKVVLSNPYDTLMEIIQDPSSYGYESAAVACCASGMFEMSYLCDQLNPFTCTDASTYVFWDSFHPTDRTNGIISDHLMKTVLAGFL